MKNRRGWLIGILLAGAAVIICYAGWGRRSLLHGLEPAYRVTNVDLSVRTMVLEKANHRYVVCCQEHCASFERGKSYAMRSIVHALEFDAEGRTITLPIVQEDVTFPVEGGRG